MSALDDKYRSSVASFVQKAAGCLPANKLTANSIRQQITSVPQQQKWYSGDTPTQREMIGRIAEIGQKDPYKASVLYDNYNRLRSDPSSPMYSYYSSSTNGAINELNNLGFDTSLLKQEDFFSDPSTATFINTNLERSGTTNSPKSPTKKTSTNGRIAYWLTQYQAAMEDTQNAKAEVEKITNKAKTLAGWKDRNYSDDEIMNIIYGKDGEQFRKDYPTLYRMQNRANEFKPVELNEAVDFTQDLLYGATWLGRNADYDGKVDLEQAMAMSYMGRGNVWNANPDIALKINPLNADGVTINKDYAPYSVGSSNLDDAVVHFNTYSFTDDWIAQNQHLLYDGTEEEKKLMKQIVEGNQNYHSATEALDALSVWEKKKLSKETDPAEAKSKLDALLEKGYLYIGTGKNEGKIFSESGKDRKKVDLGILNKMDLTMGKGDSLPTADLLPMSQGVDYKYDNYVSHLNDLCSQNASVPNETSTVNDIAKETSAPYAALKAPAKAKGAELPENMPEAAQAPAAAAGITPITEAEQEQIEAQNKKIREAADLTEGIASDNETAVMRNSGSVAFNRVKESFGTMRTFPALVEGFSKTAINMGTTDVLNESLDSVHDISEYMTVQSNYESDSATYAEYEAKYGPVEYLMKPFEKEKTVQVGDFRVSMEYLFSGTENNRPGYVITNIAAPERGGGLFYDDIVSYAESGIDWAIDAMQEAEKAAKAESSEAFKILEAQNNMLGQKNGEKEVEEYKNLVPKMQNEKEYLDSNEAKNKEQQAVIQKSVEKLNMMYEAATLLGQDTTQIDKAFDFLESMVQFHDEPQLPVQEMGKLEYIDEIGKTYGKQFTMHEKRKMIHDSLDGIDRQIQQIEDNIAYADETGYQIPGQYEQNMQYTLNDLKMERKAFEYAAILTDTDPDELRAAYEAGKAFEKKYARDMVTWQGMFGTEDSPEYYYTLGEKQTAVANDDHTEYKFITNDDRTVYYYLLGKKVQELGGELDRLWEGQTGNKSTAEIRDAVTEILKDADAFVEYMNDKDYGIWTTKRAKNAGQMGRDLVESSPLGGVAANLAATAISPLENLVNIGYTIDQAITGGRFNPNAPSRLASLFKQETREATTESIEKAYADKPVAKWLAKLGYEVYSNHGDSVMNAMFTGMFMPDIANPILNELIGSMPMGFSAGVNAAMEAVENGANTDQAWFILGTTVMAETVSEAVTRSNIMEALGETGELTKETIKNAAIDWLTRSGIEEMIGETATDVFENWCNEKAADWFDNPNFESEHQKLIDYYMANGAANREEAEAKAWEQEIKGFVHTAFVSYVSAGTDVLIKTGKAAVNTVRNSADIVNGYRAYTKGRQKLGYNTSMFGYMAQDLKTAMNKNTASGQEASVAVPANEEQDESAKQAATDVLAIGRVQKSNATTQTEMVASILDNGDGGETASEQANAAATFLNNVFGEDTSYIVQQCVMGTVKSGISRDVVTTALQNAAMGNGAATAIVQSESFLQATPEQKAQMLADTVEADQGNPDVQQSIADHVKDYRMGTGISELAAQGHFDQAQADQDAADRAAAETTKADAQLEEKQEMLEAATKDLQQKSEDVNRDASDDNTKQQADAATRVSSADESVRQYEQHKEKAKAVQKEAEAKAAKSKQDAMTSARETVGQNMEAVDQQRTEAAQQKAEADRIAAEEQAEANRQQKITDQRSGKTAEESARAKIQRLAEAKGYTGEQAEQFVNDVMNYWQTGQVNKIDLSKQFSKSEGYLMMGALSRRFGVNVDITDIASGENGYYNPNTNTITLNKNLPAGQVLVEFALHELTHSLENTGAYQQYHDTVLNILYPSEAELNDAVAKKMADYEDEGHSINETQAKNELVAEFTRLRLNDKAMVQRMVDAGLGGRVRNALHNVNQFLKNIKLTGESRTEAENLRRTERMFQKAIRERSRAQAKARTEAIKQANTPAAKLERSATPVVSNAQGDAEVSEVRGGTISRTDGDTEYSVSSWTDEEKQRVRDQLKDRMMSENDGSMTEEEMDAKIDKWINDVNDIAYIIANDRNRLDYTADPEKTMLKPNAEYVKTLDASTLCAKRLLYQGTFDAIQHQLPNTPLMPADLIDLANMMRDMGYEAPCGICYVESRRRQLGKFTEQWLESYEGEYKPTLDEVTTSDGLERLRSAHPQAYQDFISAMNKKGTMNPKVVQLRTDYRGEISQMTPAQVQKVKDIGGLRVQSFSDFETPHLIDMMQAVMDMSSQKLTAQAYTKVPNFPWVFGDTGIKINLSLIGKGTGLDENGNLLFDNVEGMPFDEAMKLRSRYSNNVGTILVGINDQHILAAMADDRIDFIIPFHKSGWSKEELTKMPVLNGYSDYTDSQNEKAIVGRDKNGKYKTESLDKSKRVNFQPVGENGYWDFSKSGKENAETYLKMCAEDGRLPKFSQFLVDNGDGSFSLQPDGSTDGYWKTLIDFKMYDNEGNGAPQQEVNPDFNMDEARRVLDEYSLERNGVSRESNNDLPVAQEVVDAYVQKYMDEHPGREYSAGMSEMTDAERNQALIDAGIITQEDAYSMPLEGQNPVMSTAQGPAQRAFGQGMLRDSDEIDDFAKTVVEAQNSYFPDTNNEQVYRAINWIRSLKQTPNSDGFAEAVNAVTKDDFDYRSADGQARMVAVMGMAVARKDTMAQVALADAFNRQGTDLGRALQARKLFKLMTPAGRISTLQKMIDNYNVDLKKNGDKEITFSHWIYEAAAAAETSEDFHKVLETAAAELATQLPISWKERLNSLRMLSMLANPRTHIRNIVGNALFVPAVGMKNKVGALLEKAFVKKGERTKTLAPVLNSEIREFARQDARTMKDTLTGEAKYDENTLVQQAKNPLGPVLGVLSDVNSRFLEGEDWLFLRGHYRRALGGWMQANGYTVDQVKNDKALLEKGREYAIQEAQKATYRDFNGVAQKLNQIARDAKTPGQKGLAFLVNAVLPFKKTPANILKRGIEYSPLGVARSVYNLGKKFRGGDVSATQVIDQFTSGLSGTAVMALGFLLAGTGAVSCGFDDEDWPEELKGKQKYSINPNAVLESLGIPRLFGEDVTYTMDWAAPMAMPFFVGASIRSQTDQEGWDANKVLDAMSSISEPVFNLSMLDGVNSLFKINSYSNQNPATQIGAKIVSNYMSSYVPSVFGAIARTLDDTQRKSYVKKEDKTFLDGVFNYAWETAENKIPGQSQNNIPVRDVWGNAKTSDLAERIIENWISPGYIEHIQDDSVVNELGRLFDSTHSKYLVPEHADQTIDGKGLEAEVYDTYDRVHGETQYSMLAELFGSKEYQDMTDDDAKVEMVRNIYSYAKKVARGAIDEDYWYEKQAVSEMIQDGKTTDYKAKMMQCIEDGNWEGYENYVEALREEGVEDSAIKSKINSKYSGQWKDAYRKYLETGNEKYSDRMAEIEELLESTGYEFNIYGNKGWEEKVDQEFQ